MSEPKLISPMLDNFAMGDPISDHNGVRCCPAMENDSKDKYLVKIISTPASKTQLDALILSGAYPSKEAALAYFKELADGIVEEAEILKKLSQLEGFVPFENWQVVPMDDENGYDIYLLNPYKRNLERFFRRQPMTHLGALNLGLDLCAALAISRRSGYLYVDLKPENVYITGENEYRIGDLGFLKLDSLKYASLPERYRSVYTAPEVADAYSAVSMTMDVYAVGLILYQAFNDGLLPLRDEAAPEAPFTPPAYADYEMSEIILKACAYDSEARYQNPIELGQALVDYMQRNGAHNTPINPACSEDAINDEIPPEDADIPEEEATAVEEPVACDVETEEDVPEITEDAIFSEDEEGNLTFITDENDDETSSDIDSAEIEYEEITEEVNEILTQVDDLIAHQAPEPVVQPEPIDVPVPPPIVLDEETPDEEAEDTENCDSESEENAEYDDVDSDADDEECEDDDGDEVVIKRSGSRWIRNGIIALLVVALFAAGFLFYRNYYLQSIDAILLKEGDKGVLTVLVSSPVPEEKLTVICTDTYGNPQTAPVVNGKAVFTDLAPNAAYNVKVVINGFHRLTGSVILGFTLDGPDADQWKILYSAEDETEKELTFTGHMANLSGLTVDKEYTFTLLPAEDIYVTGVTQIKHTVSNIVKAEKLFITGCIDNKLTAQWQAPENSNIESWTVRCYNDADFDQTVVVNETSVAFENIDLATGYTLEVTAAGMSVSERTFIAANALTVQNFTVNDSNPNYITVSWTPADSATEQNWVLMYSVDGSATHEISCNTETSVIITPKIPGAEYTFTLQTANGTAVLGGSGTHKVAEAKAFNSYNVSEDGMTFKMCKTPSKKNWDRHDLKKSDYTTKFAIGQKASFLVKMLDKYKKSKDKVVTLFVIRDENGNVVSSGSHTATWTSMWDNKYCELNIPQMPKTEGSYTIQVFFNGALANEQAFTITP